GRFQQPRRGIAETVVVVHQVDTCHRHCLSPPFRRRQGESEHAAAALARLEEQPPLVVFDDRAADRQADAQAVALGGEEGREQLCALLLAESLATVTYAYFDLAVQVHPSFDAQA